MSLPKPDTRLSDGDRVCTYRDRFRLVGYSQNIPSVVASMHRSVSSTFPLPGLPIGWKSSDCCAGIPTLYSICVLTFTFTVRFPALKDSFIELQLLISGLAVPYAEIPSHLAQLEPYILGSSHMHVSDANFSRLNSLPSSSVHDVFNPHLLHSEEPPRSVGIGIPNGTPLRSELEPQYLQ
jgi:hypothetical protein